MTKSFLIIILLFGFKQTSQSQTFKLKYTSYESETLDKNEGLTRTNERYGKSIIKMHNNTLTIIKDQNIIANLTYNEKHKCFIGGGVENNTISNYMQGNLFNNTIKLSIIIRDLYNKKTLENIILVYIKNN